MKRILTGLLCLFLLAGGASAYMIGFEAPMTVESGTPLYIDGTSTLPAGFSTEMNFFRKASVGNKEVATVPFTIQDGGDWHIEVDTTGWTDGTYTMSIPANSEYSYGSSSTLLRTFTVTGNPPTKIPTTAPTQAATAVQTEVPQTEATPVPTQSSPAAIWICIAGAAVAMVIVERKKEKLIFTFKN